jgi:D-glycero-D-manno-heptose 1,7-bisphosphate phosphatase
MIDEAAREYSVDLPKSYMVGDRWRDIAAGRAAGCLTIFIDYGYVQDGPNDPDYVVTSVSEAADLILARSVSRDAKRQ